MSKESTNAEPSKTRSTANAESSSGTKPPVVERGVVVEGLRLATAMNDAPRALYARAALVVLPEIGFTWRDYTPILEHYASERRVFALDWPGFGSSATPSATAYSYSDQHLAYTFSGWMDGLGIGRAVLLGNGLSAMAAIRYAVAHPKRTLGLALISPIGFAPGGISSPLAARILRAPALLKRLDGTVTSLLVGPAATAAARAVLERQKQARKEPEHAASLQASAALWRSAQSSAADVVRLAKEVTAPVMVLRGALDPLVTEAEAREAAATVGTHGTLAITLPDAGHLPFLQQPERFYQALSGLLETAEVVALESPAAQE